LRWSQGMTLIAGPAPIVDFDGTLARLVVDWEGLRRNLGVHSLDDLWQRDAGAWATVTEAEVAAAQTAEPVAGMVAELGACRGFAVLTSNAEAAVRAFCARFPALEKRLVAVAGRESLRGPKRDPRCFGIGFEICAAATGPLRPGLTPTYVGDLPWELRFAADLGATAFDVVDVEHEHRRPG
jgi:hypothetical protein